MSRRNWVIIVLSIVIWLPVLNLLISRTALPKTVFTLTYIALLVCPIISIINIIIVLKIWHEIKTFSVLNLLILISNGVFLTVGMKYLKQVAWFV